jgi:hypothetical protein
VPRGPLPTTYYELLDLLPHQSLTALDRSKTMALMAARDALRAAEDDLRVAVRESYDAGDSWLTIGTVLGISRQAAQRRFRRQDAASDAQDAPSDDQDAPSDAQDAPFNEPGAPSAEAATPPTSH